MNLIFRMLMWLIQFVVVVGLAGGLVDLTRSMGQEAIKAHKTGIVSLQRKAFEGLLDKVDAFAPDLIIISAGFDAHARDPAAQQSLEAEDYAWATRAIVSVARARASGRVVSSLEGGYDLQALGQSALAHARALQGD